jgi:hypothetical protein
MRGRLFLIILKVTQSLFYTTAARFYLIEWPLKGNITCKIYLLRFFLHKWIFCTADFSTEYWKNIMPLKRQVIRYNCKHSSHLKILKTILLFLVLQREFSELLFPVLLIATLYIVNIFYIGISYFSSYSSVSFRNSSSLFFWSLWNLARLRSMSLVYRWFSSFICCRWLCRNSFSDTSAFLWTSDIWSAIYNKKIKQWSDVGLTRYSSSMGHFAILT